jgi:hypothetical protein
MRRFVPFTCDQEIAAIGRGLLDRSLPKPAWTHAAHFAATLWILACRPDLEASRDMPGLIRAYNEATGGVNSDTAGYHHTITLASIRAAQDFRARHAEQPLFEVANRLLASRLGEPDWLLAYWSRPVLLSVQARRLWVEPDISALPY